MTKFVRVENADSNVQAQVKVEVWEDGAEDRMVESHYLFSPTDRRTFTLFKGRYLEDR